MIRGCSTELSSAAIYHRYLLNRTKLSTQQRTVSTFSAIQKGIRKSSNRFPDSRNGAGSSFTARKPRYDGGRNDDRYPQRELIGRNKWSNQDRTPFSRGSEKPFSPRFSADAGSDSRQTREYKGHNQSRGGSLDRENGSYGDAERKPYGERKPFNDRGQSSTSFLSSRFNSTRNAKESSRRSEPFKKRFDDGQSRGSDVTQKYGERKPFGEQKALGRPWDRDQKPSQDNNRIGFHGTRKYETSDRKTFDGGDGRTTPFRNDKFSSGSTPGYRQNQESFKNDRERKPFADRAERTLPPGSSYRSEFRRGSSSTGPDHLHNQSGSGGPGVYKKKSFGDDVGRDSTRNGLVSHSYSNSSSASTEQYPDPRDELSMYASKPPRPQKLPLAITYTTPASEFLYGTSVVTAALKSDSRKLYNLYVYQGENSLGQRQTDSIMKLALSRGIKVNTVHTQDWLSLLDKMSTGRPHNVSGSLPD